MSSVPQPTVDERPQEAGPARLFSAGMAASLERFNDPQLLAEGRVILVSVEAVKERFGSRWALRQDQVHEFTDRVVERGVGDAGAYVRISPTDYLIVHLDRERLAAQAACLRYLREVLHHFLGESHMADLGVLEVHRIGTDQILAEVVDAAAADQADHLRVSPPAPEAGRRAGASPDQWSPFVAGDGRLLRVSARLEPVYELRRLTRIGLRAIPKVTAVGSEEELSRADIRCLPSADILQVDLATLARCLNRLRDQSSSLQQPSLIVPVSYISLASQRGRAEIVRLMKETVGLLQRGVICEICDIEGVPPSSLQAATSLIRPFVLLVAARLADPHRRRADAPLASQGVRAVTLECPPLPSDKAFEEWSAGAVPAAKRASRSVIVYGVSSPQRAVGLALMGATHVSVNFR